MRRVEIAHAPPLDWDAYVLDHGRATPYHLARMVEVGRVVFGLRCYYLTARGEDGEICGLLPLVEQQGVLFRRRFVSLPFFTYGGLLCNDDTAAIELANAAARLAAESGVNRIEYRHAQDVPALGYSVRTDKVSMVLPLPSTPGELDRRLGSKLRSQIRRADRVNPQVRVGGVELLGDFYRVFCSVMRDLGTPVFPLRFLAAVLDAAGPAASIVVLNIDATPAAAAILLRSRDRMEVPWAATLNRFRSDAVNMRLYRELLVLSIRNGATTFDFGRSTVGSGTQRFKRQWGAEPQQLFWHQWARDTQPGDVRPEDIRSRMDVAVRVWRRLPLPVANWLGPRISARLPW
jgi:FemAB-related protein (PEP-CTERM system-associated)